MTTLCTADIHLSANARDDYRHQFMARLAKLAKKAGIRRTLLLGDLTEQKDHHGDWLTNQVVDMIERYAALGDVFVLQGNHDSSSDPTTPFFGFVKHIRNVQWIGRPEEFYLAGLGYCLFLPHTRSYKKDWAEWIEQDFAGFDWIFAHNTFAGANLGHGKRLDGIPLEVFPRKARVVAGDVHVPQSWDCLTYVGAPYSIDFGDNYKPRVLLLDGNKQSSIPALDSDPQKRLFDISSPEEFRRERLHAGDIVKVRYHLRREKADDWPALRNAIHKTIEDAQAIAHAIVPVLSQREGKAIDYKHIDPLSDVELIESFAKQRGFSPKTIEAGRKLL